MRTLFIIKCVLVIASVLVLVLIFKKTIEQFHDSFSSEPHTNPNLAWILQFNYEPHVEVLKTLLQCYSRNFELIIIVSPTGRVGPLLDFRSNEYSSAEVLFSIGCPTHVQITAGLMTFCYSMGLQILQGHPKFTDTQYIVLSNDDVILNMTKVKEFARVGLPVSHLAGPNYPPPLFEQPPANRRSYFKGWGYAEDWPICQKLFSKVPPKYKRRFIKRHGPSAMKGGVDVFFLPKDSVSEFLFLTNFISLCWIELGIPNVLGMLSRETKFYTEDSGVFMYRWYIEIQSPEGFMRELGNHSIVSFHPFKLSYPEHRAAMVQFMIKYKFNL